MGDLLLCPATVPVKWIVAEIGKEKEDGAMDVFF